MRFHVKNEDIAFNITFMPTDGHEIDLLYYSNRLSYGCIDRERGLVLGYSVPDTTIPLANMQAYWDLRRQYTKVVVTADEKNVEYGGWSILQDKLPSSLFGSRGLRPSRYFQRAYRETQEAHIQRWWVAELGDNPRAHCVVQIKGAAVIEWHVEEITLPYHEIIPEMMGLLKTATHNLIARINIALPTLYTPEA